MNLNDVRLFIQVVEHNSFTSAAEKLNIQKSTISRRIAQLEDELGVRLLQRTTRKLSLTNEGQELFNSCQPLLDELNSVADQVTSNQSDPKGRLRITMPPEMGIYIMNNVVASFMQQYPKIQLEVELSPRVVDLVEEGFDLAVRVGKLSDSSLIGRKIADSRLALFASRGYIDTYGEPKTPDDLYDHQCIGTSATVNGWAFSNWNEGKPLNLSCRIGANSLSFCREMMRQDLGIARMPSSFCRELVASGELVEILKGYQPPPVEIHALYPSKRHLNPKVRLFLDHLIEGLKDHSWFN